MHKVEARRLIASMAAINFTVRQRFAVGERPPRVTTSITRACYYYYNY